MEVVVAAVYPEAALWMCVAGRGGMWLVRSLVSHGKYQLHTGMCKDCTVWGLENWWGFNLKIALGYLECRKHLAGGLVSFLKVWLRHLKSLKMGRMGFINLPLCSLCSWKNGGPSSPTFLRIPNCEKLCHIYSKFAYICIPFLSLNYRESLHRFAYLFLFLFQIWGRNLKECLCGRLRSTPLSLGASTWPPLKAHLYSLDHPLAKASRALLTRANSALFTKRMQLAWAMMAAKPQKYCCLCSLQLFSISQLPWQLLQLEGAIFPAENMDFSPPLSPPF